MVPPGHKPTCHCLACSPPSVRSRLDLYQRVTERGCWEWTGARHTFGYGLITVGNKSLSVHRVAYAELVGPIPQGHSVLHRCDNPPCFNPEHLFTGTQRDNMRDRNAKGRDNNFWRSCTHCRNGHEFTAANTRRDFRGFRRCRACEAVSRQARRQEREAS